MTCFDILLNSHFCALVKFMATKKAVTQPSEFDTYVSMRQAAGQMDLRLHHFLSTKGMTLTQFLILDSVNKAKSITPMELAFELCVSPASITYTSRHLAKEKLLVKKIDSKDRRSAKLALTSKGKTTVQTLSKSLSVIAKEYLGVLKEREIEQLHAKSEKIKTELPILPNFPRF